MPMGVLHSASLYSYICCFIRFLLKFSLSGHITSLPCVDETLCSYVARSVVHWRNFTLKSGGDQWRRQDLVSGARRSRRRRREHRGAKGTEWGGVLGGVSAPQPIRGSGERSELPQRGPGGAPAAIAFSAYFRLQNASVRLRIAWKIANSTLKKWWWQSPPLSKVVVTSHHRHIQSSAYGVVCVFVCGVCQSVYGHRTELWLYIPCIICSDIVFHRKCMSQ